MLMQRSSYCQFSHISSESRRRKNIRPRIIRNNQDAGRAKGNCARKSNIPEFASIIPVEVRITVTSALGVTLHSSCRETSGVVWRRKDVTKYAQAPEKGVSGRLHAVGDLLVLIL